MSKIIKRIVNLDSAAGGSNPSSIHRSGAAAARGLGNAREVVACALQVHADEIIFTSGGTEGNNLAILGAARHRVSVGHSVSRVHIITSRIEHASILEPCRQLERDGFAVTYLPVNRDGLIDLKELSNALRPDTVLVSVGYANNEIGVIQPLREIAKIIRRFRNIQHRVSHKVCDTRCSTPPYFHTDACQAPHFLDCRAPTLGVDMMTLNGDKIYGPKGVGCLYVRRGVDLQPILYGGGQERGMRSGTENWPGIVGFAKALAQRVKIGEKESARLTKLRDYFIKCLLEFPGVTLNGSLESRLPNNVNISFTDTDSESVVLGLDAAGVLASSGSACSTHTKDASYVIAALGRGPEIARSAVRFTLNCDTTKADLNYILKILPDILQRSRIDL